MYVSITVDFSLGLSSLYVSVKLPDAVPKLIEMTLNDEDEDVRTAGVKSLSSLVQEKNGSLACLYTQSI